MIEIYRTKNKDVLRKVEILLERKIGKGFEIKRTENGKPYVVGNPLYFSISHSADRAVIAIADKPVGIDLELYKKRDFSHILSRFTEREQNWIDNTYSLFLTSWVAKEAYIKMIGGKIARDLKRLEFFNYELYADGKNLGRQAVFADSAGIYCVCAENVSYSEINPAKIFRLRKDERI